MTQRHAPQSAASQDMPTPTSWNEPTRPRAAWHRVKVHVHILLRALRNASQGVRRLPMSRASLVHAPIVAESRSPLWLDGREDEFILRCGKVQNLRAAIRGLNGLEVLAGEHMSFWTQIGRPSRWRGFVVGREIIQDCVVPTVGGLVSGVQRFGIRGGCGRGPIDRAPSPQRTH